MAGGVDQARDRGRQVRFALAPRLFPRTDKLQCVPGAIGHRRAHPLACQLQRHDSFAHLDSASSPKCTRRYIVPGA